MSRFDFSALTAMWVRAVDRAAAKLPRDETFYAIAFHGAYAERGSRIDGYVVGASSEEAFRALHDGERDEPGFDGLRWHPPDWPYEQLDLPGGATNARMYRRLSAYGRELTYARWDRLHAQHERAIVAAARELARRARAGTGGFAKLRRSRDFVVFVHSPSRSGAELARRTIPKATFARLFPEQAERAAARAAFARLPSAEQIRRWVATLDEDARASLVRRGAAAVPALVGALNHRERGWRAAMTLAEIGAPAAAAAADALLAHVRRNKHTAMWSAKALGRLGRIDDLVALTGRAATRANAILGLAAARPASYDALAALLDDDAAAKLVADALRPGSARYTKRPADLPALVAAAASPHVVIRRDAACALSDQELEPVYPKCAALLAAMLRDPDAEVRRLVLNGLGFVGRAGRPHRRAVAAFTGDADPRIAEAAKHALSRMT